MDQLVVGGGIATGLGSFAWFLLHLFRQTAVERGDLLDRYVSELAYEREVNAAKEAEIVELRRALDDCRAGR